MAVKKALLVDLDRCIGCHACEVACKQEHGFGPGVTGIELHEAGPVTLDGELAMDLIPLCTRYCDLCAARAAGGKRTACVDVCPTEALQTCEPAGLVRLLRSGGRHQVSGLQP